jgi:hypothetical protein
MSLGQEYREWFQEHPPAFTDQIHTIKTFGDRLVVCMSKSPERFGEGDGPMWGVEMRIKDEGAPTKFQSVDVSLNKPFHDHDEAQEYLERLIDLARDYTELARYMEGGE